MHKNYIKEILLIYCDLSYLNKQRKLIYLLMASPLCFSCSYNTGLSLKEKTILITEIKTTLSDYHRDIRESGLLAELKYLDSTSDFYWVPPGYTSAISYDSVFKVLMQNAGNFSLIDNHFELLDIHPINKTVATYSGRLKSLMTDHFGKTDSVLLIESGVMIKRREGWKLLSGQTNIIK